VAPVTTMQIYWGAVPFVLIQIVMVGLIIAFPAIVTGGLDKTEKIDLNKVMQEMNREFRQTEPAMPAASGAIPEALMPNPAQEQAQERKSEDEEQKRIEELFKK
jgi:GntP family gluconate:H+ symporter